MFNSNGNHQPTNEEHDGGLQVEHADLAGGHDTKWGEENYWQKSSCRDRDELPQPEGTHQEKNVKTFKSRI